MAGVSDFACLGLVLKFHKEGKSPKTIRWVMVLGPLLCCERIYFVGDGLKEEGQLIGLLRARLAIVYLKNMYFSKKEASQTVL